MTTSLDERLLEAGTGALELFGVYLGTRLDLYRILAEQGPQTANQLADRAGIHPRYAREWLEQQAVSGFLAVDPARDASEAVFTLPAEHVGPLVDGDDLTHLAPLADMLVGVAGVLEEVVGAYRTGGGVPYRHYGAAFRRGQGGITRPAYTTELTGSWLPAMADLNERLSRPGARIADVGCGLGYSTVALATGRHGRATVGGSRHGAPPGDRGRARRRGRLRTRRGHRHRRRVLPGLPAPRGAPSLTGCHRRSAT